MIQALHTNPHYASNLASVNKGKRRK